MIEVCLFVCFFWTATAAIIPTDMTFKVFLNIKMTFSFVLMNKIFMRIFFSDGSTLKPCLYKQATVQNFRQIIMTRLSRWICRKEVQLFNQQSERVGKEKLFAELVLTDDHLDVFLMLVHVVTHCLHSVCLKHTEYYFWIICLCREKSGLFWL